MGRDVEAPSPTDSIDGAVGAGRAANDRPYGFYRWCGGTGNPSPTGDTDCHGPAALAMTEEGRFAVVRVGATGVRGVREK